MRLGCLFASALLAAALVACNKGVIVGTAGGYQNFKGTLSNGEVFQGTAWHDAEANRNGFCSYIGEAECRAEFPPAGPDGYAPIKFQCSDGRTGTSTTEGRPRRGTYEALTSWIEMSDGTIGAVDYSGLRPWLGGELCRS